MHTVENARRQVAISGRVFDDLTKAAIPAAQVRITQGPQAFVEGIIRRARNAHFGLATLDALVPLLKEKNKEYATPEELLGAARGIMGDSRAGIVNRVRAARAIMDSTQTTLDERLIAAQTVLDSLQSRQLATLKRGDQTYTAKDGSFFFMDLPKGDYTLEISLPGSGTRYEARKLKMTTVAYDNFGKILLEAPLDINLSPTGLQGTVFDTDQNKIRMAEIRMVGSGEFAYSAMGDVQGGEGIYQLARLEIGEREFRLSARGYQTKTDKVVLRQGDMVAHDFFLTPIA